MDVDLISELPDDVIHRILSFLSTIDAVRTSLLSRRWRRTWYSVPTIEFNDNGFKKESLYCFLEQCLNHLKVGYRDAKPVITKFRLEMLYCDHKSPLDNWIKSHLDNWLGFIAQPHLEELVLNMRRVYKRRELYRLPQAVRNLTSLTILKLEYVKLGACFPIRLPSLKSLNMRVVEVEDSMLNNLVLGCPSLEELRLVECATLFSLRISSLRLKLLDIFWLDSLEQIQLEAVNLESFCFGGEWDSNCDLSSCKNLTTLRLINAYFEHPEDFQKLISVLPLLESLLIIDSTLYDVRHQNLKVLVFEKFDDFLGQNYEISIDAPNLVSFSYRDEETLIHFLMNVPNLLEANIDLKCYFSRRGRKDLGYHVDDVITMGWYEDILDFLSCLNCFRSMTLHVHSEEVLMFPEKFKNMHDSPLLNLKHLNVTTEREIRRKSDLRDALLWLSPSLETLSIEQKKV